MIRALLLDLDGTLYDQPALHRRIALDLLRAYRTTPVRGYRAIRALRSFRRAQEALRSSGACGDIAAIQLQLACDESNYSPAFVTQCVSAWMENAPLRHLTDCMNRAVPELLEYARLAGIRLAVCSDYPALRKLQSMGIDHFFDQVISAQQTEVGCLKPHPRILNLALQRLGIPHSEALYAGDRMGIDGKAAAGANIAYVNIVQRASHNGITIASLLDRIKDHQGARGDMWS